MMATTNRWRRSLLWVGKLRGGVLVGGILWGICGVLFGACQDAAQVQESRLSEQPTQQQSPVNGVTPDDARQISGLVKAIFDAAAQGDSDQLMTLVHTETMVQDLLRRGILPEMEDDELNRFHDDFTATMTMLVIPMVSNLTGSEDPSVHRITSLGNDRVTAIVRNWDDESETTGTTRWWLRRVDSDEWKLTDIEDLDLGFRFSMMLAFGMRIGKESPDWGPSFLRLAQLMMEFEINDDSQQRQEMVSIIDELMQESFPEEVRHFIWSLRCHVLMIESPGSDEALASIDRLIQYLPNYPTAHFHRGQTLLQRESYEEAVKEFQHYADEMGWDTDTCEMISDAYYGLDDRKAAVDAAERGLKLQPTAWGCLSSLVLALPSAQKARATPYFQKIEFPEGALAASLDWAAENGDRDATQYILGLLKEHHPDSELIPFYGGSIW